MIGALVPYVGKIRRSYQSNDIIDRLNYQYTALIIMVGAMTLVATQYVGKPIQCWVPAQFTGAWEKYTETYCFIKGSYYIPDDSEIDDDFINRDEAVIGYYQWVPLVLAFQAFLFYLPSLIWKALNFSTGINVKSILVNAALIKKKVDTKSRETQVKKTAMHIIESVHMQHSLTQRKYSPGRVKTTGLFLTGLYLFTKFLYIVNIFVQFAIFSLFLNTKTTFWGWDILVDLWQGREWQETGNFPRVTMCDFNVRVLGSIHRWTVQCVLMINMFTEKIYVFLWFWCLFVGVLSIMSFCYWMVALAIRGSQREFVLKYLRCMSMIEPTPSKQDEKRVSKFVTHYLTPDGVFLVRLVQTNGGDLLAGEMIAELYRHYLDSEGKTPEGDVTFGESPDSSSTLPR